MPAERGLLIVAPGAGPQVDLGGLGVQFKIWGEATAGGLSIVEHPMAPGRLAMPHVHQVEDELSYVLEGAIGVRVGDEIATAGPGTYVYKPKGIPHTFWNAGPAPARLIEIIWPAGFEHYFAKMGEAVRTAASPAEFGARAMQLRADYQLGLLPEWIEELKGRYQLKLLGEP
jgi:mannose-6-phosphate isomerase-like protein (cupin superfamily)